MRVVVVGGGRVGRTALKSLYELHDCTVVDVDASLLDGLAQAFDVATVKGSGARRDTLLEAGVREADLVIASTSRDEVNIVTALLARRLSHARTAVRAREMDYLEAWRAGDLDIDVLVSSAFETAAAVTRVLGVPGARHADAFAGGAVLVLGFEVEEGARLPLAGRPLGQAQLPQHSRVAGILRDGHPVAPAPDASLRPGDRVIVMASPDAAHAWSRLFTDDEPIHRVALFGAGRTGTAIARVLLDRGMDLRVVEVDAARARQASEQLEGARVFHASAIDPGFLRRERIGHARAAICATDDDSRNLHAAVLAKLHGVGLTVTILDDPASAEAFEAVGVDAAVDPADETAEKMVRYTLSERTRQVAMIEDDRFEVLDIGVRSDSHLVHRRITELPGATTMVGALVRDGEVRFPDGNEQLRAGDRVIVLTEPECVSAVERDL